MIRLWWVVNHAISEKICSFAVSILLHQATLLQISAFSPLGTAHRPIEYFFMFFETFV